MRFKYSLAYPLIIIISLVAAATLYIGYYLNIHSLQETIEAREMDRAQAIHHHVASTIGDLVKDLEAFAHFAGKNPLLVDALIAYLAHNDKDALKKTMDQFSSPIEAIGGNFCLLIDQHSNILYRSSGYPGGDNLSWVWGQEEALSGSGVTALGVGSQGWNILILAPLVRKHTQYGVIILGISLNDAFAQKLAAATLTQISFGNAYQIIASSWPATAGRPVDLGRITDSILKKQSIYLNNDQSNLSSAYIPLEIVDETICLVINADTTAIAQLFQRKQRQLVCTLGLVLIITVGLGSVLSIAIVKPLKKLRDQSIGAIREFADQDFSLPALGNEIATLSQTVELMLSTIRQHIHELRQAEEAMRQSESRIRSLYESVHAGVILQGRDGRIIHANQVACDFFAVNLNELTDRISQNTGWNMVLEDGTPIPGNEYPSMLTLRSGRPIRNAVRGIFAHDRDKIRWLLINTEPLLDPQTAEVREVTITFLDITDQKQAEDALKESESNLQTSIKEKDVLLNEVHHRVKNNLQIVTSFLNFSKKQTQNRETIDILNEAQARIHNMAMIHMQLYQTKDFGKIDLKSHAQLMVDYLGRIFSHSILIEKKIQGEEIFLTLNQAIPCSMALVELISNVFKHAFGPGEKGSLVITFQKVNERGVHISVKDNGKGLPLDFNVSKISTMGLELTWGLVEKQLRGKIDLVPGTGTEFVIEFEITD